MLVVLLALPSSGCSLAGAPSFAWFGAYFPAWLFCAFIGIGGAIAARVVFVAAGWSDALPYPLAVCVSVGTLLAVLVWRLCFG